MSDLRIRFVTCEDPVSRAIRAGLGGFPYSHVEFITPDNACALGAFMQLGISTRSVDYGVGEWSRTLTVSLPVLPEEAEKTFAYAKAQIGKPYDTAEILTMTQGSLFAHLPDWDHSDAFICSALVTKSLLAGGVFKSFPIDPRNATPRDVLVSVGALVPLQSHGIEWSAATK